MLQGMAATSDNPIRKNAGQPAWRQLADILRRQILDGEYQPGEPIPSERQLQEQYQLSRGPVRRAIALLRDEGLVVTVAGSGTFVDSELSQHEAC